MPGPHTPCLILEALGVDYKCLWNGSMVEYDECSGPCAVLQMQVQGPHAGHYTEGSSGAYSIPYHIKLLALLIENYPRHIRSS
jgi:hypothetical protein